MDFPDCDQSVLRQLFLDELNAAPIPAEKLKSNGGQVPDYWEGRYGDWLRENAAQEFEKEYLQWEWVNRKDLMKRYGRRSW